MFLTFISILLYIKNITGYLHVTMIEQLLKSKINEFIITVSRFSVQQNRIWSG